MLSRIRDVIVKNSSVPAVFLKIVKSVTGCPFDELVVNNDILCWRKMENDSFGGCTSISLKKIVPKSLVPKVIELMHDEPTRAHPGREETLRQLRQKFHWKGMYSDVQKYVHECNTCNSYKGTTDKNVPIGQYPIPTTPFQRVAVDLITNLSSTVRGNKVLLVCVDQLTRYTELIPLPNKTGKECALAIFNCIFCRYGPPQLIISDNGTEFNNELMQNLCDVFGVQKVNILPYHPASNGLVERTNRKILDVFRHTVGPDEQWDLRLPLVQCSLNTRVHASTKVTPIKALMGYNPRLPYDWMNEPVSPVYNDDPIKIRLNNFKFIHQQLTKNLTEAQLEMVDKHNENIKPVLYKRDDHVYIKNDVRSGLNYKLTKKFIGPCKVLETTGVKIQVQTPDGKVLWVHKDKVKKITIQTVTQDSHSRENTVSTPQPHTSHSSENQFHDNSESRRPNKKRITFNRQTEVRTIPRLRRYTQNRYNLRNQRS